MKTRKLAVIMFTDIVGYSKKAHAGEMQGLKLQMRHNVMCVPIDGMKIKRVLSLLYVDGII